MTQNLKFGIKQFINQFSFRKKDVDELFKIFVRDLALLINCINSRIKNKLKNGRDLKTLGKNFRSKFKRYIKLNKCETNIEDPSLTNPRSITNFQPSDKNNIDKISIFDFIVNQHRMQSKKDLEKIPKKSWKFDPKSTYGSFNHMKIIIDSVSQLFFSNSSNQEIYKKFVYDSNKNMK